MRSEKPKAKVLTMPKREFVELTPRENVEGIMRILRADMQCKRESVNA